MKFLTIFIAFVTILNLVLPLWAYKAGSLLSDPGTGPAYEFQCDCNYHSGGCTISKAPPEGYACRCIYRGYWTCEGREKRCGSDVYCPSNCYTQECCQNGGGDCGGY